MFSRNGAVSACQRKGKHTSSRCKLRRLTPAIGHPEANGCYRLVQEVEGRPMFNELLKSNPLIILILAFVLTLVATPAVYLFAQQQSLSEMRTRELDAFYRLERINRQMELQADQLSRLQNELQQTKTDVAQLKANLDVALKTIVEQQRRQPPAQ
jgi:uncharacterized protein HemX